ncbi:MAG: integrase, partial [Pseudomonadota bacterium]
MGRGRKPADKWMPPRVYRGKCKYELHPAKGGAIALCSLESTPADVWAAYQASLQKSILTVGNLADQYFKSTQYKRRRPKTQEGYADSWKTIKKVFEDVDATKVKQKHIRQYMDKRGLTGEVSANRDLSLIYNIFAHGFERSLVRQNPCVGVRKFPESPRDYYIEDNEYELFLSRSTPIIQVFMELSYVEAARGQDVRAIMLSDIKDKGVYIQQEKTGKKQLKLWTPRLQDAVDAALEIRKRILLSMSKRGAVASMYVLINKWGQPYTADGLKTIWAQNKARIKKEYDMSIQWTFHDIKAKGISDYEGNKQEFSGHKS